MSTINDTTEATTDETEAPPMTLPEILAARTRRVEREQREAAELAQRKREGQQQDALTAFTVGYEQAFPQALRDALAAVIGYDSTEEGFDDMREERGPFATFGHDGDPWTIRIANYHWYLSGPNGYHADLGYNDQFTQHTAILLDALNEYPSWLKAKIARKREQDERTAAKTRADQHNRDAMPLYAYIAGDDHTHYGILHTESKVWLEIATPDTADERMAYERIDRIQAAIVDWDAQWLLINEDDDETRQRLIPITRVVSIQARA